MDGNKDEALKCVALARESMKSGDLGRAAKLLARAERMFPTDEAKDVLRDCMGRSEGGVAVDGAAEGRGSNETNFPSRAASYGTPPMRKRKSTASQNVKNRNEDAAPSFAHSASSEHCGRNEMNSEGLPRTHSSGPSSSSQSSYNPTWICEHVLRQKCYYAILGVTKDASEDAIKKAYKRLALLLHPDKNKAPRAEEAFKKINKVSRTLLDPEERRTYDAGGEDAISGRVQRQTTTVRHVTFEDLFNFLYHAHFRQEGRARGGRNTEQVPTAAEMLSLICQILPMIIFCFVMIFASFSPLSQSSVTPYSIRATRDYPHSRHTQMHAVPYFVNDSFLREILPVEEALSDVEKSIELQYFQLLCKEETTILTNELRTAHFYNVSQEKIKQLLDRPLPNCQMLQSLKRAY